MKKSAYIVWYSKENAENLGCWYDDMKIKVFSKKKDAEEFCKKFDELDYDENVYFGMKRKTIEF